MMRLNVMAWWNCHIKLNDTSVNACKRSQPVKFEGKERIQHRMQRMIHSNSICKLAFIGISHKQFSTPEIHRCIENHLFMTKNNQINELHSSAPFVFIPIVTCALCAEKLSMLRQSINCPIVIVLFIGEHHGGGCFLLDARCGVGRESKESSPRTN